MALGVHWNPYGLLGLGLMLTAWTMAALIIRARPDAVQNQRLATQLGIEGFVVGTFGGALWFLDSPHVVYGIMVAGFVLVWPKLWTYFRFLATLPTPMARWLARPIVLNSIGVVTALLGASVLFNIDAYMVTVTQGFGGWVAVPGPWFVTIMQIWAVAWLIGLAFSISAYMTAKTPTTRRQARSYMIAFGTRDILFLVYALLLTAIPITSPWFMPYFLSIDLIWIIYTFLVGYALLKDQILDIDLKLKLTVRGSTVAALVAAGFFVLSEVIETLLPIHDDLVGILSAGGIALALRPIQGAAQRFSDRLMPTVDTSPGYLENRRLDLYRAAVESAYEDDRLTDAEESVLKTLRQQLDIAVEEAERIHAQVGDGARPTPAEG